MTTTFIPVLEAHGAMKTHIGHVRRMNQDRGLALNKASVYAVADGMGGMPAGEVASRIAIEAFEAAYLMDPTFNGLVEAAEVANASVWSDGMTYPAHRDMGSTLVAMALITDDIGTAFNVAHVGDSRLYRLRDGELIQLTRDHTVAQEMADSGQMSLEQAEAQGYGHSLTNFIGTRFVKVDNFIVVPKDGDRYLLCSDGLQEITDNLIAEILMLTDTAEDAAQKLIDSVLCTVARDNTTVVVVDVSEAA